MSEKKLLFFKTRQSTLPEWAMNIQGATYAKVCAAFNLIRLLACELTPRVIGQQDGKLAITMKTGIEYAVLKFENDVRAAKLLPAGVELGCRCCVVQGMRDQFFEKYDRACKALKDSVDETFSKTLKGGTRVPSVHLSAQLEQSARFRRRTTSPCLSDPR